MGDFKFEKIIDNVLVSAKHITKKVTVKANEAVENAKITFAISETERKISECKEKIGDIIYKEYMKTKDFEGELGEYCRMIENLYDDIEVMKDKKAEVKSSIRCKRCGNLNDDRNSFCSECGEDLTCDIEKEDENEQ